VLFTIIAGVLVAPAPPAWACSCAKIDAFAYADVAFTGRVITIDQDGGGGDRVTFAVESVQKGTAGDQLVLTTSGSEVSCGFDFTEGHRYRIFARAGSTGLCNGNAELSAFTSPPGIDEPPAVVEPLAGEPTATTTAGTTLWAYGIGLVILLTGAAAGAVLVRRHRNQ
jgi:hypothetical protein